MYSSSSESVRRSARISSACDSDENEPIALGYKKKYSAFIISDEDDACAVDDNDEDFKPHSRPKTPRKQYAKATKRLKGKHTEDKAFSCF